MLVSAWGARVQWRVVSSVRRSAQDQMLKYGSFATSGTAGGRSAGPGGAAGAPGAVPPGAASARPARRVRRVRNVRIFIGILVLVFVWNSSSTGPRRPVRGQHRNVGSTGA